MEASRRLQPADGVSSAVAVAWYEGSGSPGCAAPCGLISEQGGVVGCGLPWPLTSLSPCSTVMFGSASAETSAAAIQTAAKATL